MKRGPELELNSISKREKIENVNQEQLNKELVVAIKDGDLKRVESLLQAGANPNYCDFSNYVLHIAVSKFNNEIVEALLKSGADTELTSNSITPLALACMKNYLPIVKTLIQFGASKKTTIPPTPLLHYAILMEQTELAAILIESGFDLEELHGDRTALHHAIESNNRIIVKKLLEHGANTEALYEGRTALHAAVRHNYTEIVKMLCESHGNLEALYNEQPLLHVAIQHGNEDSAKILINANCNLESTYKNATPLHYAIKLSMITGAFKIGLYLLAKGANTETLYDNMTPLFHAIKLKRSLFARHLIRANVNVNASCHGVSIMHQSILSGDEAVVTELIQKGAHKTVPIQSLKAIHNGAILDDLIPHATLFGYSFSSLLKNPSLINLIDKMHMFHYENNVVDYLEKSEFCSEVIVAALRILQSADKIKEFERSQIVGNETAMNDAKVVRARWHFSNKVQPHFKAQFLQHSSTGNAEEALVAVEKRIKAFILEEIKKKAESENNTAILEFLTTHGNALLEGNEDALKASCLVLNTVETLQSAWRCYNPYAPVKANWANLLTEPANDVKVFSTAAAHSGEITAKEASRIIRERVAYYFLAVMDENDGDDAVRETRKMNFLSQLNDIRNAHGPDDPTCYPGAITRSADMGSFHEVAQLPITTKEWLSDYFKTKALAALEQEFGKLTTVEDKQALTNAITQLTEGSINAIIQDPANYPKEWLTLRKRFIDSLGSSQENLEKIFLEDSTPITQADLIYIEQCLLDIGAGDRGQAVATFFNRNTDHVPTQDEIEQANPFKAQENEFGLSKLMLEVILHFVPSYAKSMRQLKTLTEFLQQKVPALLQGQPLSEVIDDMRFAPEVQAEVFNAINANWKFIPVVVNPFTAKIEAARKQIELKANQPQFQMVFQKQLATLVRKNEFFIRYYPLIQEIFENVKPKADSAEIARMAEELATYFAIEDDFIKTEFIKQFDESYVNKNATLFETISAKLTKPADQTLRTSF